MAYQVIELILSSRWRRRTGHVKNNVYLLHERSDCRNDGEMRGEICKGRLTIWDEEKEPACGICKDAVFQQIF